MWGDAQHLRGHVDIFFVFKAPLCKGGSRVAGGGLFYYNPSVSFADTSPYTGEANNERGVFLAGEVDNGSGFPLQGRLTMEVGFLYRRS